MARIRNSTLIFQMCRKLLAWVAMTCMGRLLLMNLWLGFDVSRFHPLALPPKWKTMLIWLPMLMVILWNRKTCLV